MCESLEKHRQPQIGSKIRILSEYYWTFFFELWFFKHHIVWTSRFTPLLVQLKVSSKQWITQGLSFLNIVSVWNQHTKGDISCQNLINNLSRGRGFKSHFGPIIRKSAVIPSWCYVKIYHFTLFLKHERSYILFEQKAKILIRWRLKSSAWIALTNHMICLSCLYKPYFKFRR